MKIIGIIGLFALIASVATHAQVDATLQLRGKSYPKLNEKECLAKGGRWGVLGIPGSPYPPECNLRTTDSEKNVESPRTVKGTAWPILPLPARRSANVPITKSKLVAVSIFRMVKLSVFATKA